MLKDLMALISHYDPEYPRKIHGATTAEIHHLEQLAHRPLPANYKEFLEYMGKDIAPRIPCGSWVNSRPTWAFKKAHSRQHTFLCSTGRMPPSWETKIRSAEAFMSMLQQVRSNSLNGWSTSSATTLNWLERKQAQPLP